MNFHIVSSTHWDREWYEPFQKYRFRLVRMIDNLIEILENEKEYRSFHMDGQTIVLGDYLQIRPENADRLKALIQSGKLEIGPWYTMPDEWLPSAESLVKNLQIGGKICKQYGVKPSPCGYICDLFGHNSQMPQIFHQFGLHSTAFFRGMEQTRKDLFTWAGADGSEVTVHKMHRDYAYSTFYFVMRMPFEKREFDPAEVERRFREFVERDKNNFSLDNVLLMDGVDHIDAERELPKLLDILRTKFPEHTFIHSDMATYFKSVQAETDKLEKFTGCLYDVAEDGVNQAVLKNCLSSLVDQKQDNAYCETALEQVLSPMNFFTCNAPQKERGKNFRAVTPYNGFLDEAWNQLIQNHAHDSICGCSVTATHLDTKNRFKNVREIAEVTEKNLMIEISENVATQKDGYDGAWIIFNHGQNDIDGITSVELPLTVSPDGRNLRLFDDKGNKLDYAVLSRREELEKDTTFNTLITFPHTEYLKTVLPLHIPAHGYTTVYYKRLVNRRDQAIGWEWQEFHPPYRMGGSMRTVGLTFDTGKISVTVNKNGTLDVTNKQTGKTYKQLLCFEDCGDIGEGWNHIPPEFDSVYYSAANDASISVEKDTETAAVIKIQNRMHLPIKADWRGRSEEKEDFFIESTVTLLKNRSTISITTAVHNKLVNHRLRAIFPTALAADKFETSLPFDYYSWDVKKKNNSYYKECDTFVNPNQGAASITYGRDSFAVYNKGLYEVAVADDEDRTMALTLFRSFTAESGSFNTNGLGTMQGDYAFEYALDFLTDTDNSEIIRRANAFKAGFSVRQTALHDGKLPVMQQIVKIDGKAILSILKSNCQLGGTTYNIARIYDVAGGDNGTLSFFRKVKKAYYTDLNGNISQEAKVVNGKIQYALTNRQVATIAFLLEN